MRESDGNGAEPFPFLLFKEIFAMPLRIAIPIPPSFSYPNYFAALSALGAEGMRLGPDMGIDGFDGLLLPGGDDISPALYGQEMRGAIDPDPALDRLQLNALDAFFRAGKPILGICRGHQLINVYFGGTLIQDIQGGSMHDWDQGLSQDKAHLTVAFSNSWLGRLYGSCFPTNSAHHQAVDQPGRGLIVDQLAADGLVEGMHHASGRVLSVQWHPERMCFSKRRSDTVDGSAALIFFLKMCARHSNSVPGGSGAAAPDYQSAVPASPARGSVFSEV